jgi:hypothetical protein
MYELKFVPQYVTLIVPSLLAFNQSVTVLVQKLPDSVVSQQSSPLTELMCQAR